MDFASHRTTRHKRHPLMNHLSLEQKQHLKEIIDTYTPDLHDPAAVEVLLVLLEVCHILDLLPCELNHLFTCRILDILDHYGDIVPPRQRPPAIRRAWVWLSNQAHPNLYRVSAKGTIRIRPQGART